MIKIQQYCEAGAARSQAFSLEPESNFNLHRHILTKELKQEEKLPASPSSHSSDSSSKGLGSLLLPWLKHEKIILPEKTSLKAYSIVKLKSYTPKNLDKTQKMVWCCEQ